FRTRVVEPPMTVDHQLDVGSDRIANRRDSRQTRLEIRCFDLRRGIAVQPELVEGRDLEGTKTVADRAARVGGESFGCTRRDATVDVGVDGNAIPQSR